MKETQVVQAAYLVMSWYCHFNSKKCFIKTNSWRSFFYDFLWVCLRTHTYSLYIYNKIEPVTFSLHRNRTAIEDSAIIQISKTSSMEPANMANITTRYCQLWRCIHMLYTFSIEPRKNMQIPIFLCIWDIYYKTLLIEFPFVWPAMSFEFLTYKLIWYRNKNVPIYNLYENTNFGSFIMQINI